MAKNNIQLQDEDYKKFINEKINEFNTNGKKTIAHFCDTYYPIVDGVIKVMENYAKRQSKKYNIVMVVPKHKNKEIVPHPDYLVIGISGMYFKFVNYDLAFPEMDSYLKNTLKKLRIDLIHCHSPFNVGSYAAKLAKRRKIPFVMTMHSQYKVDFLKYTKNEGLANMLTKNITKVFNKATEVWTMHEKVADALRSYGYKGTFSYMPNATDYLIPENPTELKHIIDEKYNLNPEDNVFLFVGRLVNQKNIQFIVDSLNILNKKGINFKMFFVGEGPDKDELKKHIEDCNLTDKVILTGLIKSREELSAYYQRANLFLFPSTYDTSSLVQIEAATFKTPGVFIENTATAQTITDRHNGYLSKETIEDYSNTILEAISDKTKLNEVTENAHKELYVSWDTVALKTMDRYEYLIKQNTNRLKKLEAVQNAMKQNKK